MYLKKYSVSIFILVIALIISCRGKDTTIQKLDKENGFQGLILGESAYSDFIIEVKLKASDDEIIEHQIFGNVIVPSKKLENENHRFVFGVLMNNLYGSALNGRVYRYNLVNDDPDSLSQNRLLDSLKTNYGPPSLIKDTTYTILDIVQVKSHIKIWDGRNLKMIYEKRKEEEGNSIYLQIIDKSAINQLKKIRMRINSLADTPSKELLQLKYIGELNLYLTKDELLSKNILEVERGDLSLNDGSYNKNYTINYNKYLKPFFVNKVKDQNDNKSIANTFLSFTSKTDSLSQLNISFNSNKLSYTDLKKILKQKFGSKFLEEKLKSKKRIYKRSFWLSNRMNIELTDRDYYVFHSYPYDEINLNVFTRNRPPTLNFLKLN